MEDLKFEGSFSFAGSDFMNSSSFAFFSDDEDDHGGGGDNDDDYIEIALDHHRSTVDDGEEGDLHELDYLRISFSSTTLPLPEVSDLVNSSAASDETVPSSSSSSSSSSSAFTAESSSSTATTYKDRPVLGSEPGRFHKTRSVRAPSSETGKRSEVEEKQLTIDSHNDDMLRNRKASKMNGGMMMMKLLIKIRGIKLGTLFASFLKPRGGEVVVVHHEDHNIINHTAAAAATDYDNNNNEKKTSESAEYYRRLFMKPLDKWFIQRNSTDNGTIKSAAAAGGVGDNKYSKLMMNISGAMRSGVLRALNFTKLDIINNSKSSCPSSFNSSPLLHHRHRHRNNNGSPTTTKPDDHNKLYYSRDNSISNIQAAIAHCKTSSSI